MAPLLLATLNLAFMIPQQTAPHVPLRTPWSQDALDGKGWLEYPRPQLERSRWMNLNGIWDCAIAERGSPPPSAYRERIRVPYPVESALSGVARAVEPSEQLWYRRHFAVPLDWKGERILLHFGAVNWNSAVWINGALAGTHQGGYDPFTIDVTPYLSPAGEQDIVVSASNPANTSDQPRGKQTLEPSGIWYTPSTGIWQTAWIEPVPAEASIAELRVVPDIDSGSVAVTVIGDRPYAPDTIAVRARVESGGKVVAEATYRLDRTLRLKIPNPVWWTPDHPFLYDLRVELFPIPNPFPGKRGFHREEGEDGFFKVPPGVEPLDAVTSYFGMRQISMVPGPQGPVFALNHQPIFMYGPLDQGFWPDGIYTAPTEAAFRHDLDFLKQAGFNGLRKHVKVEPELYYRYCDQIGLLVWQDMPSGMTELAPDTGAQEPSPEFVAFNAGEAILSSAAAAQFQLELRRMIDALAHHPCIVVWVPFNEGWGQHDTARLGGWIKAYDPTRLVDDASGWKDVGSGDIRDIHTYHPHPMMPAEPDPSRITVIGEFGGVALPCPGHTWFEKGWGYQQSEDSAQLASDYRQRVAAIAAGISTHGIAAAIYTQTTDVEGELNGLMTYDRKVIKIPVAELKQINETLYLP
jgi:beta-galactosidase/beta-glucuronidase